MQRFKSILIGMLAVAFIGTVFGCKEEAAAAYDKAARERKGSAAVCNFASAEEGQAGAACTAAGRVMPKGIYRGGLSDACVK